ncbi:hypothetical protein RB195_024739 [Necator americanus]|uniref:Uncharacterized protein n=1 Tax=Necator americanus TaxID=51031 RepID=A0ABR1EPF5_NECAM
MGIAQCRDSCGDRPHTHQMEAVKEKRSRLRRLRTRGILTPRGLRTCAERASKLRTTNLDRISKTTKELLERRRASRLDSNASHIERQKKILEAAQRRTSLKKCRRDLREYNIPLAALLSEDETHTSSRREMEIRRGPTRTFSLHQLLCQARELDEAQPQEQAGFRQRFSCLDHIQTVSRVIEICREENRTHTYHVYLGHSMNMENDSKGKLNRRMRAALREATDQLTDQDLRVHLFDSSVLPALC